MCRGVIAAPLPNLRRLRLPFPAIDVSALAALAKAEWLPRLTALDLEVLTDAATRAVAGLPECPELRVFRCDVWNTESPTDTVFAAPLLRNVVDLSVTGVRENAAHGLLDAPILEQLR